VFGPHLIIDGSRCDTKKLGDRNLVEQVMNDYPKAIGMTKIGGPYMFEYQAPDPAYSGISSIVVIAESHIAIHTFPELDYFTMDIFSCKNFDHETAIAYIRDAFDVKEMDRMLVQRGLNFRGPHHGKQGATDDLIAAAQARLAAGVVSKEPALPDIVPADELAGARAAAAARRSGQDQRSAVSPSRSAEDQRSAVPPSRSAEGEPTGHMIWPHYGVTPDYGTYGAAAEESCEPCVRGGAVIVPLTQTQPASASVQVNPTASISGLLDKMTALAGPGAALGQALTEWERLARDGETTIALALAAPVIACGMRELLVYAAEHRYFEVVVAGADDLFADLYEALGHVHFAGEGVPMATEEGRSATLAFATELLSGIEPDSVTTSADLWRRIGEALPARVPRKGLLQAAAQTDVSIFTPDLSASAFGPALLAARAQGKGPALDSAEDVLELARVLAGRPRLGVIRVGEGAQVGLLAQAREAASPLGLPVATLVGSVTIGASHALARGEHHVAVPTDAGLVLPLVVTGLAQRLPAARKLADRGAKMAVDGAIGTQVGAVDRAVHAHAARRDHKKAASRLREVAPA
jgi:S-adenosylmethionine decarboxylase